MNDTGEARSWLVLLHQLPPKPDYLRVRIRRRLQQIGAVPLKNAAYVLPNDEPSAELFQWLIAEIERDGGSAMLMTSQFVAGVADADLVEAFEAALAPAFADLAAEARRHAERDAAVGPAVVNRLRKRLGELAERDRLGSAGQASARAALAELEQRLEKAAAPEQRPLGATWVTRHNVFVDRMASAWLIRRFIDPKAKFKFVAAHGYRLAAGERGFDLFEGGYGHQGDQCTFETLAEVYALRADPGVAAIGEIVHDLDLQDDKYRRSESAGVLALLQGIRTRYASDAERLEHGRRLFDQLHSSLSRAP